MLLFVADDDAPSRMVLGSLFGADYEVELFDSAAACLSRLEGARPDILLLSADLPGMEAFGMCRRLKADPATAHIPVVFVSRDDGLENRLLGYDSGGEDFIPKPYSVDEMRRRLQVVRQAVERTAALHGRAADSEQLSSLLLSNMDEYAVLIKYMRSLNECAGEEDIARALLAALAGFRLEGAVQVRLPWGRFTLGAQGRDRPLEISVMDHVSGLGRIFQFRRRCVYNYGTATLLVGNMPWDDPDTCGRLRDHLAIAAEMADARLQALVLARQNFRTREGIGELREEIRQTIGLHVKRYEDARRAGAIMVGELFDELAVSFSHLGLSRELEEDIENIIRNKARGLVAIYDNADQATATLASLGERLEGMLA